MADLYGHDTPGGNIGGSGELQFDPVQRQYGNIILPVSFRDVDRHRPAVALEQRRILQLRRDPVYGGDPCLPGLKRIAQVNGCFSPRFEFADVAILRIGVHHELLRNHLSGLRPFRQERLLRQRRQFRHECA